MMTIYYITVLYEGRNPFGRYGLYYRGRYIKCVRIYILSTYIHINKYYIGVAQCVMFGKHPTEVPPNILYFNIRPQIIRHQLNYVF